MTDETTPTEAAEEAVAPPLPARLAAPGEQFEYADTEGTLQQLEADADGHVQPRNAYEDQLLEQRNLPRIEADPDGPSYRELQAEAKDLGIPANGSKAELTAAIAAAKTAAEDQGMTSGGDATSGDAPTPGSDEASSGADENTEANA
jgi:hypothetical protein